MWRRSILVVSALALAAAGCGLPGVGGNGDDNGPEVTPSETEPDAGDLQGLDDQAGDVNGEDPELPEAGQLGSDEENLPAPGELDGATGADLPVPADVSVDELARHPGGTVFDVTDVTFSGHEIRVNAELINGAQSEILVYLEGSRRLRLVDDLGGVYNYVVPSDLSGRNLELEQGDSVSGEFVFLGPVSSNANSLTLVANSNQDNPLSSDMESHSETSHNPVLVVEGIPLQW